jgi:hypothetical protein
MTTEPEGVDIDSVHYKRDDGLAPARGVIICIPAALLAWALIAAVAVAYKYFF